MHSTYCNNMLQIGVQQIIKILLLNQNNKGLVFYNKRDVLIMQFNVYIHSFRVMNSTSLNYSSSWGAGSQRLGNQQAERWTTVEEEVVHHRLTKVGFWM